MQNDMVNIPKALKIWFVIHFFADIFTAIPLFFYPDIILLLGWEVVDSFAIRLVAAALFGIGIESLLGRNASAETFKNMLNLKIIWSAAAFLGLLFSVLQSSKTPWGALIFLAIFFVFNIVWVYWRYRIGRLLKTSL